MHPVLRFCENPRLHPTPRLFCPCQSGKQKYSVPAVQPHLLCTEPQEQACQKAKSSSGAVLGDGAAGQVAWCCAPGPWLGSHRVCTAISSSEFVNLQVLDTILQPDPFFSFLKDAFSSPKTQRAGGYTSSASACYVVSAIANPRAKAAQRCYLPSPFLPLHPQTVLNMSMTE